MQFAIAASTCNSTLTIELKLKIIVPNNTKQNKKWTKSTVINTPNPATLCWQRASSCHRHLHGSQTRPIQHNSPCPHTALTYRTQVAHPRCPYPFHRHIPPFTANWNTNQKNVNANIIHTIIVFSTIRNTATTTMWSNTINICTNRSARSRSATKNCFYHPIKNWKSRTKNVNNWRCWINSIRVG